MSLNQESIYCNICISKYSCSLLMLFLQTLFFEKYCTLVRVKYIFIEFRRENSHRGIVFLAYFRSISCTYLANVCRKGTLGIENEVEYLAVKSRRFTDN